MLESIIVFVFLFVFVYMFVFIFVIFSVDIIQRKLSRIVTSSGIRWTSFINIVGQCEVSVASVSRIVKTYRRHDYFLLNGKINVVIKQKRTDRTL